MFTAKRLASYLDITPAEAKTVREILLLSLKRGERCKYEAESPEYEVYHDSASRKLYMVNRILSGYHGVEILRSVNDTMYKFNGISYLNTGDSYGATLMYDHGRGKWLLACWGDIVERQPRRFGFGD